MDLLHEDTTDDRYKDISMKHFGSWEEVRLTEILGSNVLVEEFLLMEIPFYHTASDNNPELSKSADLILYGYREVVGSGTRVSSPEMLAKKAEIFNLPKEDYEPYLSTRSLPNYKSTSGFGLGWQRYTQWLLRTPFIWEAVHIPRGEQLPRP